MRKRAMLYLTRKYKRSVLLLLLLFVISFSIAVGLSVWNSINLVAKELQQTLGTSFIFKLPDSITQDGSYYVDVKQKDGSVGKAYNGPKLDEDTISQVMQGTAGITAYNAELDHLVYTDDMSLFPGLHASPVSTGDLFEDKIEEIYARTTSVYGNSDTTLYDKFRNGQFELVEGRHITQTDDRKALISDVLADINGLQVGDTFHLSLRAGQLRDRDAFKIWGESQELEIVGIFHVSGYQPTGEWVAEMDSTYNWILTDLSTVSYFIEAFDQSFYEGKPTQIRYRNVTFFVEDPSQLEAVLDQVKDLETVDTKYYDIAIDDTMYRSTVGPLNTIRNLIVSFGAAIAIGCAGVLCIVFTMWVRSRRQEIAVYLSMGIGKAAILGQFVLEAGMIALLAGLLSFAACQQVPDMIGNHLLASKIEAAQPEAREITREDIHQAVSSGTTDQLFFYEGSDYAGPERIDFTFRIADFFLLLLLEFLIITGAICKGGSFIFKLQPRQIMTELR